MTTPTDKSSELLSLAETLGWINQQASHGMSIAAGAATTHGDPGGGLEWLNSILSDIAINAEMALEAIRASQEANP